MGSILRRGARAAAILILLVAPAAHAQEYEDETGDLDLEVAVSITVTISGEGYVPGSVVYVTLTSADGEDEYDLGTVPLDDQGRFFAEISLPDDLPDGVYSISATGVTAQGATRVLSARVAVGADVTIATDEPTTTTSSTTVSETETSIVEPAPIETTGTTAPVPDPDDPPVPPVLFLGMGAVGGIALGSGWWWIYRAIRK